MDLSDDCVRRTIEQMESQFAHPVRNAIVGFLVVTGAMTAATMSLITLAAQLDGRWLPS